MAQKSLLEGSGDAKDGTQVSHVQGRCPPLAVLWLWPLKRDSVLRFYKSLENWPHTPHAPPYGLSPLRSHRITIQFSMQKFPHQRDFVALWPWELFPSFHLRVQEVRHVQAAMPRTVRPLAAPQGSQLPCRS